MEDYKDVFQRFYDIATDELGMNDAEAGKYANDMMYDHFADIADMARMREKYGEQV